MYYLLIVISVIMFGGCFALNDTYRKIRGSSFKVSMEQACLGSASGLVILFIIGGFRLEFTLFTFAMALLSSLCGMAFTVCAFKSLDVINLSLFSLFSMLGGMLLPFLQGIIFYNEAITLSKLVCLLFIIGALILTVSLKEKKRGAIYYVGIFIFNGMSGVVSKIFTSSALKKTDAVSFSIWIAICTATISGTIWLLMSLHKKDKHEKYGIKPLIVSLSNGGINRVANFLLVLALAHVDASVQYPMVTGGTMIVSTLICFFGDKKPTGRDIASIVLAFVGMLSLFLIPI